MGTKSVGANTGRPITYAELPPAKPRPVGDGAPAVADLERALHVTNTGPKAPAVRRETRHHA